MIWAVKVVQRSRSEQSQAEEQALKSDGRSPEGKGFQSDKASGHPEIEAQSPDVRSRAEVEVSILWRIIDF